MADFTKKTKPGEETKGTGQAITKWKDNKQTHEQTKYKELTEEEGDAVRLNTGHAESADSTHRKGNNKHKTDFTKVGR